MYHNRVPPGAASALGMSPRPRLPDVIPRRFSFSSEERAVYNRPNLGGQMAVAFVPGDTIPLFCIDVRYVPFFVLMPIPNIYCLFLAMLSSTAERIFRRDHHALTSMISCANFWQSGCD
jgi:hypothetical protein